MQFKGRSSSFSSMTSLYILTYNNNIYTLASAFFLILSSLPMALGCSEYLHCVCDHGNSQWDNVATEAMCAQHLNGVVETDSSGRKVGATTNPDFIDNCKWQNAYEAEMGVRGVSNYWAKSITEYSA